MLTIVWLIVWLINHTPPVHDWNSWMISLVVCGSLDFVGLLRTGKGVL